MVALVAALVAIGALVGGGDGSSQGAAAGTGYDRARVDRIAARVEELRGLRFKRPVAVEVVSAAEARRTGLAELDRAGSARERRIDEEVLKLIGLLPADADLRQVASLVYGEQVAGFYDPRNGRLALVRGAGVDDVTLAHELAHALEDQHFDLERLGESRDDDRAAAEQALVEGTATLVMSEYARRWPTDTPVGDLLAGLTQISGSTPLPPYVMRSLVFPYLQGERFASALRDTTGGDWRLVDLALRARPPATTAEILDARRWLRVERPEPVRLGGGELLRGDGWRRLTSSTLGAEALAALLSEREGPLVSRELTEGWRGGRYALWRRGPFPAPDCREPCRERDVLELAIAVAEPAQARRLADALRRWGDGVPTGSAVAVRVGADDGRVVRVALAPWRELAEALTR